jgi:long-subunit acyl-CoA synthetase (AMP-forming)
VNSLIAQLLKRCAAQPDDDALRSRDLRLSYAELLDAVEYATEQLRSLELRRIGLYLDNGLDWIIFDLAALAAGITAVPLPRFFSSAQIVHAIDDANLDGIIFDHELPPGVTASGVALPGFSDSRIQCTESCNGSLAPRSPETPASSTSAPARVSYTSGSTGAPKGVELGADFIEQTATSLCQAIADLDINVHLSILPYATLLENIAGIYVPLLLGRCVHAEPAVDVGLNDALGLDPAKLVTCFNRVRPNSLIITPQLLELLCQLVENAAINPDCLVFVAVGGARVAPTLLQRARQAGIPAYEGYGLTEFASVATLNTPRNDRIGSVGKPLPGVSVSVAEDGEICLARDLPCETGKGRQALVRTGDLGSIDGDDFVQLHGRKSNLIVLANGRNVSPEWIEAELNASPLILQSYVFSDNGEQLAALLASPATDAALETAINCINQDLPAYARVSEWHRLTTPFSRAAQTLTANGRLRRQQIAQQLPELLSRGNASLTPGRSPGRISLQESNPC